MNSYNFSFTLAPCLCEFDISMLDRLSPVFNGSPFTPNIDNHQNESKSTINQSVQADPFTMTLESSSVDIRLRLVHQCAQASLLKFSKERKKYWLICLLSNRFPCTDLRPIHTPDRVPWWKRNVLRDSLYINFCQVKLFYHSNKYEIIANKIDIYYSVSKHLHFIVADKLIKQIKVWKLTFFTCESKKANNIKQNMYIWFHRKVMMSKRSTSEMLSRLNSQPKSTHNTMQKVQSNYPLCCSQNDKWHQF